MDSKTNKSKNTKNTANKSTLIARMDEEAKAVVGFNSKKEAFKYLDNIYKNKKK